MDNDRTEQWKGGQNTIPKPSTNRLGCRVRQAFDVIQVVVVELSNDGIDRPFDVAVIDQVALGFVDVAFHHNIKTERVPVEPPALVAIRERG